MRGRSHRGAKSRNVCVELRVRPTVIEPRPHIERDECGIARQPFEARERVRERRVRRGAARMR
jgi:hypothetical protein